MARRRRPAWVGLVFLALAALSVMVPGAARADDAGLVLFVSNRSGNAQVHVMRADGSADQALTRTPEENVEPAWSPDGRTVAFTSYRDGNAEIYVMNADGSQQRRLTRHDLSDNSPAWTADGRIVFRSMRSRWANLYRMDADGGNLEPLTDTPVDKGVPVVSPDGRWIAFVAHGEKGDADIHVIPAQGGSARDLTGAFSKDKKSFPSWAPDSTRLAFQESKGLALNIMVVTLDGAPPVSLTRNAYTNAYPVWSPDGKRIGFVSSREGTRTEMARGDIYVMNADGSGQANLTRHPGEDNHPAWSTDGRSILFVSLRDGKSQIYSVPADGGPVRRLTHSAGFDLMIRPLAAPNNPH